MNFSALNLSAPILKALEAEGYTKPTPVQSQAIPAIIQGKDVMAAAQTGTGKTAGFTLPILELLAKGKPACEHQVRAVILTPTRELAAQVANSIATYGKHIKLRFAVVFGGVKIYPQKVALRKGVDILVATPGRLLDLYNQKAMKFDPVEILVLDEADRMLDMGFIHDIKKIMSILPKKRQNLMFSATFSNEVRALAKGLMHNAVEISVTSPHTTVQSIEQFVYTVDKKQKTALLSHIISEGRWKQVLIFARTRYGADRLAQQLEMDGIDAIAIHGNKSQGARTKALANFKTGRVRALVATDVAARGLDIELLPHVVNYDLPQTAGDYVHRIGRTGRAGATGQAISLVSADEARQLADIERFIKQKLPRKVVDNFEPRHRVSEARAERTERPRTKHAVRYRERGSETPRRNNNSRNEPRRDSRDFDIRDSRSKDSSKETRFGARDDSRRRDRNSDSKKSFNQDSRYKTRDERDARSKDIKRGDSRDTRRSDFRSDSPFKTRDTRSESRRDSRDERRTPRNNSGRPGDRFNSRGRR